MARGREGKGVEKRLSFINNILYLLGIVLSTVHVYLFIFVITRRYSIDFRKNGREGKRHREENIAVRETHPVVTSHMHPSLRTPPD